MDASILAEEQLDEELQLLPQTAGNIYTTKLVNFFDRSTPIILQNENGPCPLLSICNVLLLRGNLKLSPDTTTVSQKKLLSLVAGHLVLSISDVNDTAEGHKSYTMQDVAAAISLLPRLTTGIDINPKFTRIADFEFTRECELFELLGIPLYHGWIVDPQDDDTATAIGSNSYNYLMGEIVALETQNFNNNTDEERVDVAGATTATLERHGVADYHSSTKLKGDLEEEAELLRALQLSEADFSYPDMVLSEDYSTDTETLCSEDSPVDQGDVVTEENSGRETNFAKLETLQATDIPSNENIAVPQETASPSTKTTNTENNTVSEKFINNLSEVKSESTSASGKYDGILDEITSDPFGHREKSKDMSTSPSYKVNAAENWNAGKTTHLSTTTASNIDSDFSNPGRVPSDGYGVDTETLCAEDSIPVDLVYAVVEEHRGRETNFAKLEASQDTDIPSNGNIIIPQETASSSTKTTSAGNIIISEKYIDNLGEVDGESTSASLPLSSMTGSKIDSDSSSQQSDKALTPHQGQLIRNFLMNNATQLTVYGLFCLQNGLKEREICVLFRNNHFSTMFKYEGELYVLASDQGYIDQPDLVWEKLNEVNGDTFFVRSDFTEFNAVSPTKNSSISNQPNLTQQKITETVDNASVEEIVDNPSVEESVDLKVSTTDYGSSDFQLAMALQEQEYGAQPQPFERSHSS